MIRLADTPRRQREFFALCRGSAFGCKLRAAAMAYGFERDFLRLWTDGSAAYCLLDGELSIAGRPEEPGEARDFLCMLGPGSVLCERGLAGELGLRVSLEGAVMARRLPKGRPAVYPTPGIREVWELLTDSGMPLEFEPFYLDMSHRLRHGAALALGEYREGRLAGCAVVSAVTEDESVLSALAVREDLRGRGIGSGLMGMVRESLPGHTLYLLRRSGRNREFYERLGFAGVGRWGQQTGR